MNQVQICYAKSITSGKPAYIREVSRGLSCNCVCYKCDEKLEAVQGDIRQWYFRHSSTSKCDGNQETAIHHLAKEIIRANNELAIPGKLLKYSNVRLEYSIENYVADTVITYENTDIYIEVFVSHKCEVAKREFYKKNRLKSIEIDISGVSFDISPTELKILILDKVETKEIIWWGDSQIVVNVDTIVQPWYNHPVIITICKVGLFVLGFFILKRLFNNKKSSRNSKRQ